MNAAKWLVLILNAWICLCSASAEGVYAFTGTCRNATEGGEGHVKLIFNETNNHIEGVMCVSGWLVGGGTVTGSREGNNVRFTSTDSSLGMVIDWQGTLVNDSLSGEYIVRANAGVNRQVGEWNVKIQAQEKADLNLSDKMAKEVMKTSVEMMLSAPVKQSDGSVVSGAENVFRAVHPAGRGVSICVEDVDIDWKAESQSRTLQDIHKFRATYVLYWQGIITPTGWTRLRLAYNSKIDAITSHEILESTGTTNQQFGEMAFGIGAILGKAAVDSMFDGK